MTFFEHIQHKIVNQDFFLENEVILHQHSLVFTNGCFDLIHFGHVSYLAQARQLGDALVVGLNSDDSVRQLKGFSRPINSLAARAMVLASLEMVDYVVAFDEDTPYNLITKVKPDILVKGGDYQIDNIVGGEFVKNYGGKVCTVPFVEGFSTTSILGKLK